jgi:hypothetical protein
MYKVNKFILFFYFTTCFRHLGHHQVNHFTFTLNFFLLFSPYIGQCLHLGGKVICIVECGCKMIYLTMAEMAQTCCKVKTI